MSERESLRRLLTIREAASFLSVSVSTLYGWVWQRRILFVKIGRALRFDSQDLEAFIAANKQIPNPDRTSSDIRVRAATIPARLAKG